MTRTTAWGLSTPRTTHWSSRAACHGTDPELWFPPAGWPKDHPKIKEAKQVCYGCPVREECLLDALRHGEEYGLWAGYTEPELRRMRRSRVPLKGGIVGDPEDLYARLNTWRQRAQLTWPELRERMGIAEAALLSLRRGRASTRTRGQVRDWLAQHREGVA